ncbi:MAG: amidohydrolase family protein [Planctomycetaceae bacterium]|nr:amidohydrolase [Planctomycetaceae bacterium]
MTYQDLRHEIESLPSINAHIHQADVAAEWPGQSPDPIALLRTALPESFADQSVLDVLNGSAPHRDKWKALLAVWPLVRCSGYGRVVAARLRALGVDDNLTETSYDQIAQRLVPYTPAEAAAAFDAVGIGGWVSNVVGHPCFGWGDGIAKFLAGELPHGKNFFPLLNAGPLHDFSSMGELEAVERAAGVSIASLDDLTGAVGKIVDACVAKGVVGIKDHRAYSRGLLFKAPVRSAAAAEFTIVRANGSLAPHQSHLSDYVLDAIVSCAGDHKLPVAMHTGLCAGRYGRCAQPQNNAALLAGLLERHADVQFDLYHLNMPWSEEMLALMQRFPNVTANCVWAQHLDGAGMEEFLLRALQALPADRILGYGSDGGGMGYILATLGLAKDAIAGALSRLVDRNFISRSAALAVARIWLYEAPCKIYKLPLPQ